MVTIKWEKKQRKKNNQGKSELLGAKDDCEKFLIEILMECSTQTLHQFHQN